MLTCARPLTVYAEGDDLVICGVRYAGELFRQLALASPGTWLRIEGRPPDGVITVFVPTAEMERTFDAISGRAAASRVK